MEFRPQPHFSQVTQVADIASTLARLNPGKVPPALFRAAGAQPREAVTGVTFFPPNTLDPTIVAPPPPQRHLMQAAAAAPVLPPYFCWADANIVADVKGWGKRPASLGPYTSPVFNQHTCGSCWAVASAGVFSDRWAIFTQDKNPNLSPTDILSCVSMKSGYSSGTAVVPFQNCDGCNGGIPAGAAALFARMGVVSGECLSYGWCDNNRVCAGQQASVGGGGDYLNNLIPRCTKQRSCSNPMRYKAKFYTVTARPQLAALSAPVMASGGFTAREINPETSAALSITGVQDIQREILANGPVVGAMAVYYDFQAGTSPGSGNWAPTKNVYCNVQGGGFRGGAKPYDGTSYANTESQLQGYHAVAVVGWGVERDVDDWTMPGRKFDLPYWIVRNSWGAQWNTGCTVNNGKVKLPGYFKIAWTDARRNINVMVNLDMASPGQLGGTTAFEPAVARAAPPGGGKKPVGAIRPYTFDPAANQCVPATDSDSATYESLDACIDAHAGAQNVSFQCDYVKGQCHAVSNGSGKYSSEESCLAECGHQRTTFLALVISGSVLVAAAIAIGVGVGVTRNRGKKGI